MKKNLVLALSVLLTTVFLKVQTSAKVVAPAKTVEILSKPMVPVSNAPIHKPCKPCVKPCASPIKTAPVSNFKKTAPNCKCKM